MDNDKISDQKDNQDNNIPNAIVDNDKLKAGRLREKALKELVDTEKTYVNSLGKLIIIYMNPLKQNNYRIITANDHQIIFPNVINAIYNLHNQLLAELDYNYLKCGSILIKYSELFKMYQIYLCSYERSQKSLKLLKKKNKKFNKWLNKQYKILKFELCGLSAPDIESLLILPIQRIPRYSLLLREIIKNTVKYNPQHNDLISLNKCYKQILEITQIIENKMREYDNKKKVSQIEIKFNNIKHGAFVTPSRYYIAESLYKQIKIHNCDGSCVDIILFLFNDCLIYGHYNEEPVKISCRKLSYDYLLSFGNLFRIEIECKYKYKYCLKIYAKEYSIWLTFRNKKLKQKWYKLIYNANETQNNKYINNLKKFHINNSNKSDHDSIQTVAYPLYVPDDYTNKCQECFSKFTSFTNRKHHCKSCGRLLCKICTNYRINSIFNKNKKNQIIKCCKKCKDQNTFNILNKNNKNINNDIIAPPSPYAHGYKRHQQINQKFFNRNSRTNSTPLLKNNYPLKNVIKSPKLKHRASQPLLLLQNSSTSIVNMAANKSKNKNKNKSNNILKYKKRRTITPILFEEKEPDKYSDKMPQSPAINPPQELGYNNDDDMDTDNDDIVTDDDDDDIMPDLILPAVNTNNNIKQHIRNCGINKKDIKIINRRKRSYAVGMLNISHLNLNLNISNSNNDNSLSIPVGCIITDEESNTDDTSRSYNGNSSGLSFIDNGSSAESKEKRNTLLSFKKYKNI